MKEVFNQDSICISVESNSRYVMIKLGNTIHYFVPEDGSYDGWSRQESTILELVENEDETR